MTVPVTVVSGVASSEMSAVISAPAVTSIGCASLGAGVEGKYVAARPVTPGLIVLPSNRLPSSGRADT